MAFPNRLLTRSTWRLVGLGLTTTLFALGTLAMLAPDFAADSLGVVPTTPEGRTITGNAMAFLGIRDLAAAVALFWFYREGKERETGILMTTWSFVCAVDAWVAIQGPRGFDNGVLPLFGGIAAFGFVGLGLLQS